MEMGSIMAQNLSSVQSAVQMSLISKMTNATAESLVVMLQGMAESGRDMEISVDRRVGLNFDAQA